MPNFSITLNFFIPDNIIEELNKTVEAVDFSFDFRKSQTCHCTVKSLYLGDDIPSKSELDKWSKEAGDVLKHTAQFKVVLRDTQLFPTVAFAKVISEDLCKIHKELFRILPSGQPHYEDDHYTPHVSLGFLKKGSQFTPIAKEFGNFEVVELQLVIWNLRDLGNPTIYQNFKLNQA